LSLDDVLRKLANIGNESETSAQKLLEDIPQLRQWQRATKATNAVRDAMMKLGSHWGVLRYAKGKKRSSEDVAGELEERMLNKN
jgi:hypothetical protein